MAGSRLSGHADIVMGQSPPGEKCNTKGHGLPLLNGPTEFGPHHPLPIQFTTDARKVAKQGDILFCVRGSTTGRMNWADRDYAIGRGLAAIRHKSKPDLQPYVRAVVEYGLRELLAQATGSTFPNVSAGQLATLWWPPIEESEQITIAHLLGNLDNKIELNRRMNETLEAMARAIFKSWFVDFDPVRAKAEGRQPFGTDAPTAALFPNSFQDSPLGKIPKGWSVSELPNEIDFLEGPGIRNWQYRNEGIRFLNIRCIVGGDLELEKANHVGLNEFRDKYSHFALATDDIVISTSGTLGRMAVVREDHLPVMLNTSIIRMRGRTPIGLAYVWGTLQSEYFLEEMHTLASGSVQLNFGPMHLRRMSILRPPDNILRAYERLSEPLLRTSLANRVESRTLAAIRDALLPKLISGELRVTKGFA